MTRILNRPRARRLSTLACVAVAVTLPLLPVLAATTPPANTAPVARLGSQTISTADLGDSTAEKLKKITSNYDRRRRELDAEEHATTQETLNSAAEQYLNDRVLALEATKTHKSKEALLKEVKTAPVTDADMQKVYDEHAREIKRPLADVAAELRKVMEQDRADTARSEYLASLRTKYDAHVLVEPVRVAVDATGPSTGPADAKVTIVMFSDFQCPFCLKVMPSVREVMARYPTSVRLVYRHLPLTGLHPNAYSAAEAAVCADRQQQFWPFLDALFEHQKQLGAELYTATARQLHLDDAAFSACLKSGEAKPTIDADVTAADEIGITGTPALLINGRLLAGYAPASAITKIIDDELARR